MPLSIALKRFFRTPKGLLTIVLVVLLIPAARAAGVALVAPLVIATVVAAEALDVFLLRWRNGRWEYPSGAVLTGLIIAMVLSPNEPWYVGACTSAIAIISKYIVRTRSANVFNPAALALVVTFYIFDTGQSWWGALPDATPYALTLLVGTGVFISDRVNKIPMVLAFLGLYYGLFTAMAFLGNPGHVAEIFRSPDLQAVLYFALFILTDPPTSPVKYQDQIVCGALIALVSVAVFEWVGAAYYLLAGVLVGNVWEAGRRIRSRR